MHGGLAALVATAVVVTLAAAQGSCNCPSSNGSCGPNCTSSAACCGSGTTDPVCLLPGDQCCTWSSAAAQCSGTDSCCGGGSGASSYAFCCGAGSSCCATTWSDGGSWCCGPKQQCCSSSRYSNTFCCDAETEVCGSEFFETCLPKNPITRNPHAKPGQLEWATDLQSPWYGVLSPVVANSSFVVATGGGGTALVRLSDGAATPVFGGVESYVTTVVAGGRVFIYNTPSLRSYDLRLGNLSWNATFEDPYHIVAHGDYVLLLGAYALAVFDARDGTVLYTIPCPLQAAKPVVSLYNTVAFAYYQALLIFRLDTGRILVNATTTAMNPPLSPLLAGSIFVSANLVAYSARSGKQLWALGSSPNLISITATTTAVVGATQEHLYFLARSSGQLINTVPIQPAGQYPGGIYGPYENVNALTPVGDVVLLASANLTAYNGTTGAQLWNYTASNYEFLVSGGAHLGYAYLPAASDDYPGAMVAVDPTTGRVAGSWGAGAGVSSPLFVDDRVLFMSEDGFLYCISLVGQEVGVSRNQAT